VRALPHTPLEHTPSTRRLRHAIRFQVILLTDLDARENYRPLFLTDAGVAEKYAVSLVHVRTSGR